jgi:hypothetical protein
MVFIPHPLFLFFIFGGGRRGIGIDYFHASGVFNPSGIDPKEARSWIR